LNPPLQALHLVALRRLIGRIGHVQIADVPDRQEPGTGELNFGVILAELDRLGYQVRVGLEYKPSRPTAKTLGWVSEHGWQIDA
jgi:hydroxypyruvate isomerase